MNAFLTHPALLVFLGGGLGSLLRYYVGQFMPTSALGQSFLVAILLVNVVASFILGCIVGFGLARAGTEPIRLLIGVGFCGGLSTFSSFSNDTLTLLQTGRIGAALLNIGLNVVLCLVASLGGLVLGQRI